MSKTNNPIKNPCCDQYVNRPVIFDGIFTTTEIMPTSLIPKFFEIVALVQHRNPMKNTLAPIRQADIAITIGPWLPEAILAAAADVVDGNDKSVADMMTEEKKNRIRQLENTIWMQMQKAGKTRL